MEKHQCSRGARFYKQDSGLDFKSFASQGQFGSPTPKIGTLV